MNKIKTISTTLIIIIVALLVLSGALTLRASAWIGGTSAKSESVEDCTTTRGLAWFIANYPERYMAATIESLFGRTNLAVTATNQNVDVCYYTADCMYHMQNSDTNNRAVRVVNVVELETPGHIKIWKKNSDGNLVTAEIDMTDFDTVEKLYKEIKDDPDVSFTEEDHRRVRYNLAMFIYSSMNYTSNEGGYYYRTDYYSSAEDVMRHYWWNQKIQQYVKSTGLLDSAFYYKPSISLQATGTRDKYKDVVNSNKVVDIPLLNKESSTPTIEYKNGKAYIGPLKATYSGGIPSIQIGGNEVKWVTKTNGTYSAEQKSKDYVSGQQFYAIIDEKEVKELTNVSVDFVLSYKAFKARITLVKNGTARGQCLMYHEGEEKTGELKETWTVEQTKKLTIQKQDASGKTLKISGVKFEVYDTNNTKVGTLTTGEDGKTTNTLGLKPNQTYTLKETYNGEYGYKNTTVSGATITNGAGTISSVSNGIVTFKLTNNATIYIKNTPELGKLTVHKVGASNTNLAGVQFAIYRNNGFIKLDKVRANRNNKHRIRYN